MSRDEILNKINEIIAEEHGDKVSEDMLLIECNIDSFGYAILWTTLEATYSFKLDVKLIDYSRLKVSDVIDICEGN